MSPSRPARSPSTLDNEHAFAEHHRIATLLGDALRSARRRRRWSMQLVGERAGLSRAAIGYVEQGRPAALETYLRLAAVLELEPSFELSPRRRKDRLPDEDPVHAAIVEVLAGRLRPFGHEVGVDVPYQHYQFAGRADLVAIDGPRSALLHTEVRTRLPNVGETAGSFNAKCEWLARDMAERADRRRFLSETHVLVLLPSSELLHTVRLRPETLRSLAPDGAAPFATWWEGRVPAAGRHRSLVLLDPTDRGGRAPRWVDLDEALRMRPRYRGYAEALEVLRRAGSA